MERIVILSEIINILEKEFPLNLQEKWDNSGLILGDKNNQIKKAQISLDITENVVDRAIENGVDLIISHHPMIFSSIKQINDSTILGKKILKLIKNGISVYALHTNLDDAKQGLNQYIAEKLMGKNIKIMDEKFYSVYKMSVFIPEFAFDEVLKVVNKSKELEFLGYKKVSYTTESIERIEEDEEIKETLSYKMEFVGEKEKLYALLNKIKAKHPYEEPSYEIIALENNYKTGTGLGRIFTIEKVSELDEYISFVKEKLELDYIKVVRSNDRPIKKVAIINGSGSEFWEKANRLGADVFITADIKYHTALDAFEKGLNLIDIGHYESEHFFNEIIIKKLSDILSLEVYNEKRILETV